jgi:SAM-dependent methyltransferase
MSESQEPPDLATAEAFAKSWNRAGQGSVYSREQFTRWLEPIDVTELRGKEVLELGFGNGSLLYHMGHVAAPKRLVGVELGDTLEQTRRNLADLPPGMLELHRGDMTAIDLGKFDLVYCIGVIHHLQFPDKGVDAVLRHVKPGARFHCWVYAREGNGIIVSFVDPLRRITSALPWWFTKYCVALPLVVPYFFYAKALAALARLTGLVARAKRLFPMYDYSVWIAKRPFPFFHHVAFDQLVTPRTTYIKRAKVDEWLRDARIEPGSVYTIYWNSNSWKFGGKLKSEPPAP